VFLFEKDGVQNVLRYEYIKFGFENGYKLRLGFLNGMVLLKSGKWWWYLDCEMRNIH